MVSHMSVRVSLGLACRVFLMKGAHLRGAGRRGVEDLSRVLPPLQPGPLPGEIYIAVQIMFGYIADHVKFVGT